MSVNTNLPTIDILTLISNRTGNDYPYFASTDGGQYVGPCPFCKAGENRFLVFPHSDRKPHYWCRICRAGGDAISFLTSFCNMTFREACEELGIDPSDNNYAGTPNPMRPDAVQTKEWIATAEEFIYAAHKCFLNSTVGTQYQIYLAERGISMETAMKYHIGVVPLKNGKWIETSFSRWGLSEENLTPVQLAKGCIRIPDGLLFPHYVDGKPWKLSMKRPFEPDARYRTGRVTGSKECLLNEDLLSSGKPVIMTEAFLDALSIDQVANDLIVVTSTDGTGCSRSLRCQSKLGYAPFVLQAFDNDIAGHEGAQWWSQRLENCVRWPSAEKDANDMLMKGHDVRAWVVEGVERINRYLSPQPVEVVESTLEYAPFEEEAESKYPWLLGECFMCKKIVEYYTNDGTPCCEQHYSGQQAIEIAMAAYTRDVIKEVPPADPLDVFNSTLARIANIFPGGCTAHIDPPGYTLQDRVAFLTDKKRREDIAYERLMHEKMLAGQRRKMDRLRLAPSEEPALTD